MLRKGLWIVFAFLCIAIGFYPVVYFLNGLHFGLLASKPDILLDNPVWKTAFLTHITGGGIALLTGWSQFSTGLRNRRPEIHRNLGKVYIISVLLSAVAGIYIALYATGGLIPAAGFLLLGIIWLVTTAGAWQHIREGRIEKHRVWMIYSYAACFAAVTLRLWLPLLMILTGDFRIAYPIVAWLCWVPNLITAFFMIQNQKKRQANVNN